MVILFADKTAKTAALIKAVSDPAAEAELAKCAYAKVDFKADAPEAKQLAVTAGGTLVFVDPVSDPPKVLKSLAAATPAQVIKEVTDGMKALKK